MLPSFAGDTQSVFRKQVLSSLRTALHLPATNPHVARWLFANPHHAFHPDARLLPPEFFDNALSVRMSLDYTDFISNINPFADPYPVYADLPALSATPTSSASLNLLLIPAARVCDVVLGYSVITSSDIGPMLNPFEVPLNYRQSLRERFCYNPATRSMLVVLNAISESATGIVSIEWLDHNRRQRTFFTVPNEEYDFYNLPSNVLAILTQLEHKIPDHHASDSDSPPANPYGSDNPPSSSRVADPFVEHPTSFDEDAEIVVGPITSDMLNGLDDLLGLSSEAKALNDASHNMFSRTDGDGIANSGHHAEVLTSAPLPTSPNTFPEAVMFPAERSVAAIRGEKATAGPFDMKDLFTAIAGLEDMLQGRFYGPKLNRDVLDPLTGEILSRKSGEMRATFVKADDCSFKKFKVATGQTYYEAALAVSTDRMLTYPGEKRNSRRVGRGAEVERRKRARVRGDGVEGEEGRTGGSEVRNSREQVADTLAGGAEDDAGGHTGESGARDSDAVKAARMEARKQRNRESAARSNRRKKELIAAEERELERLKIRIKELKEVEQRLELENKRLKRRPT